MADSAPAEREGALGDVSLAGNIKADGKLIPNPNSAFGRRLRKDFLFDENYVNMNHGT